MRLLVSWLVLPCLFVMGCYEKTAFEHAVTIAVILISLWIALKEYGK